MKIYVNIFWYEHESIIIRAYKDMIGAMNDTCDINDLYYAASLGQYFDFSEDLRDINIDIEKYIKDTLDILNNAKIDYVIYNYYHQDLKGNVNYDIKEDM